MSISARIFEIMKERRMSQKEFAQRTGIPESTISDWKRKNNTPSADKIMDICETLQVSPYDLLGADIESGEMVVNMESDLGAMVKVYKHLGKEQQNRVLGYAQGLLDITAKGE